MVELLNRNELVELTTEIVTSYLSYHKVGPAEIGVIIGSVAGGLSKLGNTQEPAPAAVQPVVPCAAVDQQRSSHLLAMWQEAEASKASPGHRTWNDTTRVQRAVRPQARLPHGGEIPVTQLPCAQSRRRRMLLRCTFRALVHLQRCRPPAPQLPKPQINNV